MVRLGWGRSRFGEGRCDEEMLGGAGKQWRRFIGMHGGRDGPGRGGGNGNFQPYFAGKTGDGQAGIVVGEVSDLVAARALNANGHGQFSVCFSVPTEVGMVVQTVGVPISAAV